MRALGLTSGHRSTVVLLLVFAATSGSSQQELPEGFVTEVPASNQRVAAASVASDAQRNWNSPAWVAIQRNLTDQYQDPNAAFENYQANRRRRYRSSAARAAAQKNFKANLDYIVKENAKKTNPYILGITNYTDLSYEEFAATYLTKLEEPPTVAGTRRRRLLQTNATTATSSCGIHWGYAQYNPLGKNVVSPVKNQGLCGSCWAFGATAQLESWIAMQNYTMDAGNFVDLAEQMLVDCSYGSGYDSCSGGWPTAAWDLIKANKGIPSSATLPYTSGATSTFTGSCPSPSPPRALGSSIMKGYNFLMQQNDDGLVAALQTQPVFTAVAAGAEFQNYVGGAMTCNGTALTHAIQTVGCGYLPVGGQYLPVYVIKNQWSVYWGYSGFGYILRTTQPGGSCMLASGAYTVY